jgi:hypothetical protein
MKIPFTLNRLLVILIIHGLCFSQVTGGIIVQDDQPSENHLSEQMPIEGDKSKDKDEILEVDLTAAPDTRTWILIAGGIILLALVVYFASATPSEAPADTGIGQPPDWPY